MTYTTSATVRTSCSSTMEITTDDGQDLVIDVPTSLAPDQSDVWIGHRSGGGYRLAWLVSDEFHPDSPIDESDMGEYREEDPYRYRNGEGRSAYDLARDAIDETGDAGRVFLVQCDDYGSSGRRYFVGRTDLKSSNGVYIVPADVPADRRADYVNGVFDEMTAWSSGEVYGIVVYEVDETGQADETDETCWGFIGTDYAEATARETASYDEARIIGAALAGLVR